MKIQTIISIAFLILQYQCIHAQKIGGPCQGCEALYDYTLPLHSKDTLVDFQHCKQKLKIIGRVTDLTGNAAAGVIVYIHHTDSLGLYSHPNPQKEWDKKHGHRRGWAKTDQTGNYTFYTSMPVMYPSRTEPKHVHFTVLDKYKTPYYIDSILFSEDPMVTEKVIAKQPNRGGSGIVKPIYHADYTIVSRDIVLGLNIPNYPSN